MASPIFEERSDLVSPKRQKKMEAQSCDDYDSKDPHSDRIDHFKGTDEEIERFNDECHKSHGYEIDFSKFTYWGNWLPVDLEDTTWSDDPDETNREFIGKLAKMALTDHNAKNGTSFEFVNVSRTNFHPSMGVTFYISFEVNDPSDGNQKTIPFRARVRYLWPDDIELSSCGPK